MAENVNDLTWNPTSQAAKQRCNPDDAKATFLALDADNNGSLDMAEFRAFTVGRFQLTMDNSDKIFALYDKDSSHTLDVNEFSAIVKEVNECVHTFDTIEMNRATSMACHAYGCAIYASMCCLCTLGSSYCCCVSYASHVAQKAQDMEMTNQKRLNEYVLEALIKRAPTKATTAETPMISRA